MNIEELQPGKLHDGWLYYDRDGLYVSSGGQYTGTRVDGRRVFKAHRPLYDHGDLAIIPSTALGTEIELVYVETVPPGK